MTRSSRHKSHKQSKHSSRNYSDSEEDVKMEKSHRDENPVRSHRDSASGEKRKILSQVRESKDVKDPSGNGNGQVLEEYVSSKRRKEKWDVSVGVDRWNGGGEERGDGDKETSQRESIKIDSKSTDSVNKGESLRIESKNKSKRYETGNVNERKEDSLASSVVDKDENKGKGESKMKFEKESSSRKEKESKDKERKSKRDKSGQESKHDGDDKKFVEVDVGKKQVSQPGDINEDRHCKRSNAERADDESWNPELERESEKKIHKRREVSSERDKHHNDSKEASERRLSSRSERAKETKHGDDKNKDTIYADKNQEDVRQRDEKNRKEPDKGTKYWVDGYRNDKREDSNKGHKRKDEKYRENGERDRRRKDDKYREGTERDYKDDRYREDVEKDNRKDERYYYEDGERDNRVKDGKHIREDIEKDVRHKDRKSGDDFDRERSMKYRDDGYAAADHHHSGKSNAYDHSPTRDGRTSARYRDDQARGKLNEKGDSGDVRSRSTKDQRPNSDKKCARMDGLPERGRPASRTADIELSSGHSRKRNSPCLSSHDTRDHFRVPKQDESKYRETYYEERVRHSTSSTREYTGPGESEKISPWSLEKQDKNGDGPLGELSNERRLKSDIRPSPLQLHDKSPSSSTDKRQFNRTEVRNPSFRDANEYSGKEGRDVPPGDEFSQAATGTLFISSPFVRNSHFSSSCKSFPPPPHSRTGIDSSLPLISTEDDYRSKSNARQRRIIDPNMGRMQGNAWRGIPSWPSPVPNGFLPFPHAPPPVGFMPPFPAPPIFSVKPSMELNHSLSSPYHMPDADRFSGHIHPMGWHQVDDSFNSWDTGNSGFGDNYRKLDWDPSRNMPGVRGWETSGDLWKGPNNKTASLEKENNNNSTRTGDETLGGQSVKLSQSEQAQAEQQTESAGISQLSRSVEKNDVGAPVIGLEEGSDVDKLSGKGDFCLSHVYLSRLDISADLVEPKVFDQCAVLIDVDQNVVSDLGDSKFFCMKEAAESDVAPHEMLSYSLFPLADDSIFQKAMSLYKKHRDNTKAEVGEKLKIPSIPNSDLNVENNKTEELGTIDDMQGVEVYTPNNSPMLEMDVDTSQMEIDQQLADGEIIEKSEELESVKSPDASLLTEVKEAYGNDSDTKLGDPFLNNDVVSSEVEAVVHESVVVSDSVNLSRIHHYPESTQ